MVCVHFQLTAHLFAWRARASTKTTMVTTYVWPILNVKTCQSINSPGTNLKMCTFTCTIPRGIWVHPGVIGMPIWSATPRECLTSQLMNPGVNWDPAATASIHLSKCTVRVSARAQGTWGRILVQVTIYRRLLIGRDGHLDQSEAYDIS